MPTKIKFVQFTNTVAFGSQIQSFSLARDSSSIAEKYLDDKEILLDDKQRFFQLRRKGGGGKWEETMVPMSNVSSFTPLEEKAEEPVKAVKK